MEGPRAKNGSPRPRPLAGSVSLLLLITVAVASSAGGVGGVQPLLAELTGQVSSERGHLRALSDRLAEVVRSVTRRAPTRATIRPPRAWDIASRGLGDQLPHRRGEAGPPPAHVRVEHLDLPPPRA